MKAMITDEEYERLNFHEQREYRWCPHCEMFIHNGYNHKCKSDENNHGET